MTYVSRRELLGILATLGILPTLDVNTLTPTTETSQKIDRLEQAFQIRIDAARFEKNAGALNHPKNGDEELYESKLGSFSKGLPHNRYGIVDHEAFSSFVHAMNSREPYQLDRIPLGGYAKLSNPQAAWTFDLIGPDGSQLQILAPPKFNSAQQAAEMCELYWQALTVDVPFTDYASNELISKASADLSKFSDFPAPKTAGSVIDSTIFRGPSPGCLIGPYISQFLWRDIPLSPIRAPQKMRTTVPSLCYMNTCEEWLDIQNGGLSGVNQFDSQPRFVRSGRDLSEFVHRDFTYQAFICAALMLFNMGTPSDGANPYQHSKTQSGFVTFGQAFVFQLVAIVTSTALKAVWFQKWLVHRKIRPEEFAGRVHFHLKKEQKYPIHSDLFNSSAPDLIFQRNRTYLLPQAFPEGCPLHPSYPAGHAAIAGACVTALKACFDESYVIPNPVSASTDGLMLIPYKGPPLTVGNELDKLAANIAIGRDFAGVHWRSDSIEGMNLGEQVAIRVLQEMKLTGNELFAGFSLSKFDGTKISI